MPPIREHSEEETSKLLDDRKRGGGKRSPSINTRASRVGVTNFINVIKSLHPGQSISYFPITRETLEEYIDAKRKAHIKSGSLEQYLQHIQAYNLALGYGWDGSVFGPLIKKSLDELRLIEEEALALTQSLQTEVSLDSSNESTNRISNLLTIDEHANIDENENIDVDLTSRRSEPLSPSKTLDTLPTLKSITIRSKSRVYKQRIAVSDTTTFASLVSFAIRLTLPPGKQLVIRDTASDLEYMPGDLVREVIKGVEHADVTAAIEDVNTIDFNYF